MTKSKIVNRFVSPGNVIEEYRASAVREARKTRRIGPIGNVQLGGEELIEAFLEKWDKLGEEGWQYVGKVEYPDLPYGGLYNFIKIEEDGETLKKEIKANIDTKDNGIKRVEDEDEKFAKDFMRDVYGDEVSPKEIAKNQSMAALKDKKMKPIVDAQQQEISKQYEEKRKKFRAVYEDKHPGKNAIYHGKETKQFKEWLEDKDKALLIEEYENL